jgi:hypothetical protein
MTIMLESRIHKLEEQNKELIFALENLIACSKGEGGTKYNAFDIAYLALRNAKQN